MEDDQPRRYGARPGALPGRPGVARPAGPQDGGKVMRAAALCVAAATLSSAAALAQSGSDALSACSLPSYVERMRCLEKLSGDVPSSPPQVAATPAPPAPAPAPAPAPPAAPPAAAAI